MVGPLATQQNTGGYSGGSSHPYINVVGGLKAALGPGVNVTYDAGCRLTDETGHAVAGGGCGRAGGGCRCRCRGAFPRPGWGEFGPDDLNLIGGQEKLVETMSASGKPVIAVLENGAPSPSIGFSSTFRRSWKAGTAQNAGLAIAQAHLGDINPGGKTPVSVPKNLGQIPCYYDHLPITGPLDYYQSKWSNLYAFGQGLSYTTFAYSGLQITPAQITPRQTATVQVTLQNTGPRAWP